MDLAQGSQSDVFSPAPMMLRARQPLRAHPAFAPMLGVWGAGLGVAVSLVLPLPFIEAFAGLLPADLPAQSARVVLAAGSAATLALVAYGIGKNLGRPRTAAAGKPSKPDAFQPFDPASELGSDSFDAPLPSGLFATEPDWLPEAPAPDALAAEAAAELAELTGPAPAGEPEPEPRELDLAGFAALPGRNAVWVHEPALEPEPEPEPEPPFDHEPDAGAVSGGADQTIAEPNPDPALVSAIARLRAVPPAELSLCEMVERFAAALQDYQATRSFGDDTDADRHEREAVLHEALGALGRITGEGRASPSAASGAALRAQLWAQADGSAEQRGAA